MSFDLAIAFDDSKYLDPQIYMFIYSIKDKLPKDTLLHVVTSRKDGDPVKEHIRNNVPSKFYYEKTPDGLVSRCKYMLNTFKIDTDKEWVIKMEADTLALKHLDSFNKILKDNLDIVMEPENRKIFVDAYEARLWRIIYKNMGIKVPNIKIKFREKDKEGLALFGTGIICIKSKHLDTVNKRWIPLTKLCEPWINLNTHPNEMAWTGMVFDEGWKWKLYDRKYKFNPIGIWRKGLFPSTELIENCIIPEDVVFFDYHRPKWLYHVSKYNSPIQKILYENQKYIPKEWNELTEKSVVELQ